MSTEDASTTQRVVQWTTPPACTVSQTMVVPRLPASGKYSVIQVLYAGLNPVDYKLASLPYGLSRLALGPAPIIPATDFVGRVRQTNDARFKDGDLVFGVNGAPSKFGTLAEFTTAKNASITKVPTDFPHERLSELGCLGVVGMTALQTLKNSNLPFAITNGSERGGRVFINGGSGGVGSMAVQIAKHVFGCDKVVASCSGGNADLVKNLGADAVIDYKKGPVADQLKQWAQTNGKFDHIVDCIGSDLSIYYQCHQYTDLDAKYINIGAGINVGGIVSLVRALLTPTALGGGQRPFAFISMSANKQDLDDLVFWMQEGKLKVLIEDGNTYDMDTAAQAYEKLKSGRTRGKLCVKIAGADQ